MKLSHFVPLHPEEKLGQLFGRAPVMQEVFKQLRKAASANIVVLLEGETGTGKDLAAQAIHLLSGRNGPFIPINLSALPSEMVASELFGHEKGAFTGAIAQHQGKFEQGRDGMVFLDEIESVDENVQVSLLRLIEEQTFFRLGGRRRISTNARLTVASNQDLQRLVTQGSFREDLFFRLNIFPIRMPPLRERRDDLSLLIPHFIRHYNRFLNKQITGISDDCLSALEQYEWPGNVRELKNMIHRAVLLCDDDELQIAHFAPQLHPVSSPSETTFSILPGTPLTEVEELVIYHTLKLVNNNRTEAAKLLGISRRALYNRLVKYQIK